MMQWLGSLQIHEFYQTQQRLRQKREKAIIIEGGREEDGSPERSTSVEGVVEERGMCEPSEEHQEEVMIEGAQAGKGIIEGAQAGEVMIEGAQAGEGIIDLVQETTGGSSDSTELVRETDTALSEPGEGST